MASVPLPYSPRAHYADPVAAALPLGGGAESVSPAANRADGVARGLSLVDSGFTYRDAAAQAGVHYATLWRAAKAREREALEQLNAGEAVARIQAKARIACEMAVERIVRDISTVHERYVQPWAWTAARLAGVAEGGVAESGVSESVGRLLTALGTRASLTAGIQVTLDPNPTQSGPNSQLCAPNGDET